MRRLASLLTLGVILSATSSTAQTLDVVRGKLASCAAKQGDLSRLSCYDELARELGATQSTTTHAPRSGEGEWSVTEKVNPIDDSRTIVLRLAADKGTTRFGEDIVLILRCMSNTTEVYIDWNDYLGSDASVTWRIGQGKARTKAWSMSTDKQATFYPNSDIAFIKQLMGVESFVAQVTPYNESPVTAVFDVAGLSNAVTPLRNTCSW